MGFETEVERVRRNDPTLTILDLSHQDLCSTGVLCLSEALLHNTSLVVVFLAGNRIGDEGAQMLAMSLPKSVQYLYLAQNMVGEHGARALCSKQLTQQLKVLDLRCNKLGCEGAVHLAMLLESNDSCLQNLALTRNNIKDAGMRRIAKALHTNRSLQSLDLRANSKCSQSTYLEFKDACRVNGTIRHISLEGEDIQGVLDLYRIGRAFRRGNEIPPNTWPALFFQFAKDPDVLNFVLRGSPELLLYE